MAVAAGFVCAVGAFLLNGMHLHTILSPNERLMVTVAFLSLGSLVGAIAGATGAIVQAIHEQRKTSNDGEQ
jgi:hypothetical protein